MVLLTGWWWSVICRKWHNSVIVARNHLPLLNLHCTKRIVRCTCPYIQRSCGRSFSGRPTTQLPLKCEIMSRMSWRPTSWDLQCSRTGLSLYMSSSALVPIGGYISNSLFNTRPCYIVTCRSVSIFPQLVSFYFTAPCYLLPVTVAGWQCLNLNRDWWLGKDVNNTSTRHFIIDDTMMVLQLRTTATTDWRRFLLCYSPHTQIWMDRLAAFRSSHLTLF